MVESCLVCLKVAMTQASILKYTSLIRIHSSIHQWNIMEPSKKPHEIPPVSTVSPRHKARLDKSVARGRDLGMSGTGPGPGRSGQSGWEGPGLWRFRPGSEVLVEEVLQKSISGFVRASRVNVAWVGCGYITPKLSKVAIRQNRIRMIR